MIPQDATALMADRFGFQDVDPENGPWVPREAVVALARALRDELGFRFFVYCAAVHYLAVEDEENPEDEHIVVAYRLRRLGPGTESVGFQVRVPMGESTPSLVSVFAGADWQEREQYDLVGVVFAGHPDLRRIMMPEDWPGHPLRRDYAIETRHHPWR